MCIFHPTLVARVLRVSIAISQKTLLIILNIAISFAVFLPTIKITSIVFVTDMLTTVLANLLNARENAPRTSVNG